MHIYIYIRTLNFKTYSHQMQLINKYAKVNRKAFKMEKKLNATNI